MTSASSWNYIPEHTSSSGAIHNIITIVADTAIIVAVIIMH